MTKVKKIIESEYEKHFSFDSINEKQEQKSTMNDYDPIFDQDLNKKKELEEKKGSYSSILPSISDLNEESSRLKKEFVNLLDNIQVDEKVKILWKQIYVNAVNDRKAAQAVFIDLYGMILGDEDKFAIHGDKVAKYLERMEKANAQLLKLVEIIGDYADLSDDSDLEVNVPKGNDLFAKLEQARNKK